MSSPMTCPYVFQKTSRYSSSECRRGWIFFCEGYSSGRAFFVQLKCGAGGFAKWTREEDFSGNCYKQLRISIPIWSIETPEVFVVGCYLPETNSSHLKIMVSNRNLLFKGKT